MTPRNLNELAALRLRDGLAEGRAELERDGHVSPETWAEIDARVDDLIDTLPAEPAIMRSPRRLGFHPVTS
jgi:hypothetical protein